MTARYLALGVVVAAVFVAGAKCGPKELDSLEGALRGAGGVSADMLDDAKSVKNLSGLSADDQARQGLALRQLDGRILESAATEMDRTASAARATAETAAKATASRAVRGDVRATFVEDLEEVTKELVEEQACQAVLDLVAPAPEEPGQGKTWTDTVAEVVDRMVALRWDRPADRWSQVVEWHEYVTGVVEDADQVTQSLLADPSAITLFARPAVQRAALAYARFCYKIPRLP